MHLSILARAFFLVCIVSSSHHLFAQLPTTQRTPEEDVDSAEVRMRSRLVPGKNLLFNGWGVTPAGEHVQSGDVALKMVIAPDKKAVVAVSAGYNKMGLTVISLDEKRESTFIPLERVFNGLAFSNDGKQLFVSGSEAGVIYIFGYAEGRLDFQRKVKPKTEEKFVFLAGLIVHPKTNDLYVCNEANHEVWVLDPESFQIKSAIDVGQHPHTCILGADSQHLYVSNWGSRSVSIIDTFQGKRVRDLTVGLRPNDMALAPDGRLFVACAGENEVHVIGTVKLEKPGQDAGPTRRLWEGTREVIATSLYPQSPEGSTPCSVAVSPNGETLFIANADNNSVMVVDISGKLLEDAKERGEKIAMVNGFIPTGWYPTAVAVTPDNDFLLIANGKGLASRASFPSQAPVPRKLHMGPTFDHPGQTFDGHISFVAKPDTAMMVEYTEQVRRNSPFHPEYLRKAPLPSNSVVPTKVGDPCPIKYVLYIIKENRTYDQV